VVTASLALLACVLVAEVAAIDAAFGARLILVGLLVVGPCCGVLTQRGRLAAALGMFAIAAAGATAIERSQRGLST
jgi:hypothetical protein